MLVRRGPAGSVYATNFRFEDAHPEAAYIAGQVDECPPMVDCNEFRIAPWLALPPDERDKTRAVTGHFWWGIDRWLPSPSTYVTIVRDPIDRLLSLHAWRAARGEIAMPLDRYLLEHRDVETANGQTRRLSGDGPAVTSGPVTRTMLDVAMENLATRCAAVGVTERFDETIVAFARALGWRSMAHERLNEGGRRVTADQLPAQVHDAAVESNQLDLELHRYADALLTTALDGVDLDAARQRIERDQQVLRLRTTVRRRVCSAKRAGSRLKRRVRRAT